MKNLFFFKHTPGSFHFCFYSLSTTCRPLTQFSQLIVNSFQSFLLLFFRACSLGDSNHSACINHAFSPPRSFFWANLLVFLFVFGDFQTGHHGSDDPFHFSSLSELAIHVPPYVSHPAEFGDVLMTGTPFSVHLHLSNFRLSSFVDWPFLFITFPCYASCIIGL